MVGTAGTRGVPPLRLLDLHQGQVLLDLGRELRYTQFSEFIYKLAEVPGIARGLERILIVKLWIP